MSLFCASLGRYGRQVSWLMEEQNPILIRFTLPTAFTRPLPYMLFPMKLNACLFAACFFLTLLGTSCKETEPPIPTDKDFKQEMRTFVEGLSAYGKNIRPGFVVIPQNGQELVSMTGDENGSLDMDYLNAIDGIGREDLYYGYNSDNKATPEDERSYITSFLDLAKSAGVSILVTDYCSTPAKMEDSYQQNEAKGYISFAADHRELDNIPTLPATPNHENSDDITQLAQARNFLYLINPGNFGSREDFVTAVSATNYDVILMDLYFDDLAFIPDQIEDLQTKANGGKRLVIAYMSIGEAEDYRYYWNSDWASNPPAWMYAENKDWKGNFKVGYWEQEWKDLIYGTDTSYLKKILNAGFDGVYLDLIDAFEYFEG